MEVVHLKVEQEITSAQYNELKELCANESGRYMPEVFGVFKSKVFDGMREHKVEASQVYSIVFKDIRFFRVKDGADYGSANLMVNYVREAEFSFNNRMYAEEQRKLALVLGELNWNKDAGIYWVMFGTEYLATARPKFIDLGGR